MKKNKKLMLGILSCATFFCASSALVSCVKKEEQKNPENTSPNDSKPNQPIDANPIINTPQTPPSTNIKKDGDNKKQGPNFEIKSPAFIKEIKDDGNITEINNGPEIIDPLESKVNKQKYKVSQEFNDSLNDDEMIVTLKFKNEIDEKLKLTIQKLNFNSDKITSTANGVVEKQNNSNVVTFKFKGLKSNAEYFIQKITYENPENKKDEEQVISQWLYETNKKQPIILLSGKLDKNLDPKNIKVEESFGKNKQSGEIYSKYNFTLTTMREAKTDVDYKIVLVNNKLDDSNQDTGSLEDEYGTLTTDREAFKTNKKEPLTKTFIVKVKKGTNEGQFAIFNLELGTWELKSLTKEKIPGIEQKDELTQKFSFIANPKLVDAKTTNDNKPTEKDNKNSNSSQETSQENQNVEYTTQDKNILGPNSEIVNNENLDSITILERPKGNETKVVSTQKYTTTQEFTETLKDNQMIIKMTFNKSVNELLFLTVEEMFASEGNDKKTSKIQGTITSINGKKYQATFNFDGLTPNAEYVLKSLTYKVSSSDTKEQEIANDRYDDKKTQGFLAGSFDKQLRVQTLNQNETSGINEGVQFTKHQFTLTTYRAAKTEVSYKIVLVNNSQSKTPNQDNDSLEDQYGTLETDVKAFKSNNQEALTRTFVLKVEKGANQGQFAIFNLEPGTWELKSLTKEKTPQVEEKNNLTFSFVVNTKPTETEVKTPQVEEITPDTTSTEKNTLNNSNQEGNNNVSDDAVETRKAQEEKTQQNQTPKIVEESAETTVSNDSVDNVVENQENSAIETPIKEISQENQNVAPETQEDNNVEATKTEEITTNSGTTEKNTLNNSSQEEVKTSTSTEETSQENEEVASETQGYKNVEAAELEEAPLIDNNENLNSIALVEQPQETKPKVVSTQKYTTTQELNDSLQNDQMIIKMKFDNKINESLFLTIEEIIASENGNKKTSKIQATITPINNKYEATFHFNNLTANAEYALKSLTYKSSDSEKEVEIASNRYDNKQTNGFLAGSFDKQLRASSLNGELVSGVNPSTKESFKKHNFTLTTNRQAKTDVKYTLVLVNNNPPQTNSSTGWDSGIEEGDIELDGEEEFVFDEAPITTTSNETPKPVKATITITINKGSNTGTGSTFSLVNGTWVIESLTKEKDTKTQEKDNLTTKDFSYVVS